jgi:hypothetical protein
LAVSTNLKLAKVTYRAWNALERIGYSRLFGRRPGSPDDKKRLPARDYFAVLMSVDILKCLPYFMLSARKSIYLFDAWPNLHDNIVQFVRDFGIQYVFCSSSQVAQRLTAAAPDRKVLWIPEGIDPSQYQHCPYSDKDIDVLQFGRKYEVYHELIVGPLERAKIVYVYERVKGEVVFPEREGFIEGLSRSKISICVPSSITHTDRSADIETMTIRYLQSMLSKCLILGHAPEEMVKLFGYNPVVEIDMRNAVGQIRAILAGYETYFPLIEKNYQTVLQSHTWHHRWSQIAKILFPIML